jgi:hypothetical protein
VTIADCAALPNGGLSRTAAVAASAPGRSSFSNWGPFERQGCSDSGKRLYTSVLQRIPGGMSGKAACFSSSATIDGPPVWSFPGAARCVPVPSGIRGEFDVPDSYCSANSEYMDVNPPSESTMFSKMNDGNVNCDA